MNLRDYQMRLFLAITTLFLSFFLISCKGDKTDNLSVGACTIEGKGLDEKGNPTKKDITVSCTENVTKTICQALEESARVGYKSEASNRGREGDIRKKELPESKFKSNRSCSQKKVLASCTTGEVVAYAYKSGNAAEDKQTKAAMKKSCDAVGEYKDLSTE